MKARGIGPVHECCPIVEDRVPEEKWEWDARRNYVKTVNGLDIGEWPYGE